MGASADVCVATANPKRILIMDTFFFKTKLERNLRSMLSTSTRMERRNPTELRRIHNTIMNHVRGCNQRDTALQYLWEADLVCVPVHSQLHWSMVVMDFRSNEFHIYDSFYNADYLPYSEALCLMKVFIFSCSFLFCFYFFIIA